MLEHERLERVEMLSQTCQREHMSHPFALRVGQGCCCLKVLEVTCFPPVLELEVPRALDFLKLHGKGFDDEVLTRVYHAQVELAMCGRLACKEYPLLTSLTLGVSRSDSVENVSELTRRAPRLRKLALMEERTGAHFDLVHSSVRIESDSLEALVVRGFPRLRRVEVIGRAHVELFLEEGAASVELV